MSDFDWRSVLRTVAPTVATMLGGPLAGMAATVVGRVLLGKGDDEPTAQAEAEAAIAAAAGTPEGLVKLRQIQQQVEEVRLKAEVDLEKIASDDRGSARQREIETKDKTPMMLAAVIVAAWVGVNIALFTFALPEGNRELAARMMGTLDAVLMMVMAYYYGTNTGSRAKDGHIADLAGQAMAQRPVAAAAPPSAVAVVTPPAPSPPGTTADDLNERQLSSGPLGGAAS